MILGDPYFNLLRGTIWIHYAVGKSQKQFNDHIMNVFYIAHRLGFNLENIFWKKLIFHMLISGIVALLSKNISYLLISEEVSGESRISRRKQLT